VMAGLVNALARQGEVGEAWGFYTSMRGSVDRARSRDAEFKASYPDPTVFDWMPITNDAGITASLSPATDGGVFEYAAPSTVGGIVLEQMQRLPPGRYRLTGRGSVEDGGDGMRPYWALVCSDAREIGRVEVNAAGQFAGVFDVGRDCPAQLLRLVARASPAIGGVAGRVERAVLVPAGAAR
jgi:pentatricopeptide repeat protein